MMQDPYLADLMDRYCFSIQTMQTLQSGSAPWKQTAGAGLTFESHGRWREVVLNVRRELTCEHCNTAFAYTFHVAEQSFGVGSQTTCDYAILKHAVERELRRRVRCPYCQEVQRVTRRAFLRREAHHNLVGVAAIGGSVVGAITLTGGGYALAGGWGLVLGSVAALVLMFRLVRWMLAKILA